MNVITKNPPVQSDLEARIVRVSRPCREHVSVEVLAPAFPEVAAGQFAQLLCRDSRAFAPRELSWRDGERPLLDVANWEARSAYLRRPFSIADFWCDRDGAAHLLFISRNIGVGTAWLDGLRAGDLLNLTGPLGRGFRVPAGDWPLLLVGGGVGIPPLLLLARQLSDAGRRDVTLIFGAMSRELFPVGLRGEPARDGVAADCLQLPGRARYPAIVTTDDGTLGLRGRVTDALALWHAERARSGASRAQPAGPAAHVLACGPEGMLAALARQTRALGLGCQLCIERQMGCGLGTCLSCVVRVRDAARPAGWRWALSCSEGPVFDRDALYEYGA